MTVGCFFVIGFPEDTKKTIKESLSLISKLAIMGVHDVTVSKFTPYPGSPYFDQLYAENKINEKQLSDTISFYDEIDASYNDVYSPKSLYYWMFFNFCALSLILRPWRFFFNIWFF